MPANLGQPVCLCRAHLKLAAKQFHYSSRAFPSHWHQRVECTSKRGARSLAVFLQHSSGLRLEEGLGSNAARLLAEVMGGYRPAYKLIWPAYQGGCAALFTVFRVTLHVARSFWLATVWRQEEKSGSTVRAVQLRQIQAILASKKH